MPEFYHNTILLYAFFLALVLVHQQYLALRYPRGKKKLIEEIRHKKCRRPVASAQFQTQITSVQSVVNRTVPWRAARNTEKYLGLACLRLLFRRRRQHRHEEEKKKKRKNWKNRIQLKNRKGNSKPIPKTPSDTA